MSDCCWRVDLGRRGFLETWELQRRLVERRQRGEIGDVLLFVEHPPTYTLGRSGKREHLLVGADALAALDAEFVETDRGGDITFHGPGQVVGYPILDLRRWVQDVHAYLRALEEVLIRALAPFGIEAAREAGYTGVWHRQGKMGAIGVRISRWVTSHGFALNVNTDLDYYRRIVPCGIVGRGVSSMTSVLDEPVSADRVRDELSTSFGSVFARTMKPAAETDLAGGALS
jgi:lipoate-protein ligase B